MPQYKITAPDGRVFHVTGDGGQEGAVAALQLHLGDTQGQPKLGIFDDLIPGNNRASSRHFKGPHLVGSGAQSGQVNDPALLKIEGRRVEVDGAFRNMTPQQQAAEVDKIARGLGITLGAGGSQPSGVDIPKVKRNVTRMINQNASEQEIDQYIASEGATVEQMRNHPTTGLFDDLADGRQKAGPWTKYQQPSGEPTIVEVEQNGQTVEVEFPAGMSDAEMTQVLRKEFPASGAQSGSGPWTKYQQPERQSSSQQQSNISRKGHRRPGDRVQPDASQMFTQGITLGAGDEITAAVGAPAFAAMNLVRREGPTGIGENFEQIKAHEDAKLAAAREQHPFASAGLELSGAFTTGAASLPSRLTSSLGRRILARSAEGAAFGGVHGFNTGSGGLEGRLENAKTGAAFGAGGGAALPIAGSTIRTVAKPITNAASSLFRPEATAANRVISALTDDGVPLDDIAAGLQQRGGEVIADMGGESTLRLARSARTTPNAQNENVAGFLAERGAEQSNRIASAIDSSLSDGGQFVRTLDDLAAKREQMAAPMYKRAFQSNAPVRLDPVVATIRKELTNHGNTPIGNALKSVARSLTDESGNLKHSVEQVHSAKMSLDDAIGTAVRSGEGNKSRVLMNVKTRLLHAMDKASPHYREARRTFADAAASERSVEQGAKLARNPTLMKPAEISRMPPSEREFLRLGYAQGLRSQIERAADSRDIVKLVSGSPVKRAALKAMFGSQRDFSKFMHTLHKEARFKMTANTVQGGSQTADKLADSALMDPGFWFQLFRGDFGGAAISGARGAVRGISGNTSKQAAATNKLLFDKTGQASNRLAKAARQTRGRNSLLDSLGSGSTRVGGVLGAIAAGQ